MEGAEEEVVMMVVVVVAVVVGMRHGFSGVCGVWKRAGTLGKEMTCDGGCVWRCVWTLSESVLSHFCCYCFCAWAWLLILRVSRVGGRGWSVCTFVPKAAAMRTERVAGGKARCCL